jgi:hypothetical protein
MTMSVFIDSNVWNLLFNFRDKFDLCAELPPEEFRILIPREIEMELACIREEKANLKAFIEATITRCRVETDTLFGFPKPRLAVTACRNASALNSLCKSGTNTASRCSPWQFP